MIYRIAIVLLFASTLLAGELKIAVVNPQRVLAESKMGKDASADIEIAKLKAKKEQDAAQAEVQAMRDALKADEGKLTDDEKNKQQKAIDAKQRGLMAKGSDAELQDLQKKELTAIKEAMTRAIRKVADKQGIDAVFEAGQLFDYQRRIDITDDVIREMDGKE